MEQNLKDLGLGYLTGFGIPALDNTWEAEASFLIFGISLDQSMTLGIQYQQAAFLFGKIREEAKLVWI